MFGHLEKRTAGAQMKAEFRCPRAISHQFTNHEHGLSLIFGILWIFTAATPAQGVRLSPLPVNISASDQWARLEEEHLKCLIQQQLDSQWEHNGTFCPLNWDGVLCWPNTAAGEVAWQPCPNYINGFKPWENATRHCMPDGTWFFDIHRNRTWTNLRSCIDRADDDSSRTDFIESHMGRIRLMYNVGYGLSLVSLLVSLVLMASFKRLRCPRNTIHLNLFVSFILRASVSFLKENILVAGLGFSFDVSQGEDESVVFNNGSSHWQCKLFFTSFHYVLAANYMWIFAEALYLHMIICVAVFSENSQLKWYLLLGWGSPVVFVVPWVIVRATLEDVYCWNTNPTSGFFWIMRGPIVLTLVVNFTIFLNIIRVLFTKLNAVNTAETKKYRFRRLARSTLVLIPLFGVHYIVFAWIHYDVDPLAEVIQLYFDMFFNSFQGFFVAVLFCFMNSEVQSEIKKKWQRFRWTHMHKMPSSRKNSQNLTFTTYVSRYRESNASASHFLEARGSVGTVSFKARPSCSLDPGILLPLKARHGAILETEEMTPMIEQSGLAALETDNDMQYL